MKGEKIYRAFHGRTPRTVRRTEFNSPKALIRLGQAYSVVYESDKLSGGGDGKRALYEHKFKRGNSIYTDETGRNLYIIGRNLRVNSSGIIN